MLQQFKNFIKTEKLFKPSDKILLAVSGGVDSVAMCELFHKAGFKFDIAHCNFSLRGEESDGDEKLVKQLAKKYKVDFACMKFDTKDFAEKNGVSIQMAARELRYNWFEDLREEKGYNYIATAHHQDDSIETFFINMIRGTGITGLTGISTKRNNIIRPLLFTTKENIVEFVKKEKLKFREDSSNASDNYMRNKIRHHIVPVLKELNPSIETTINATISKLKDVEEIYKKEVQSQFDDCLSYEGRYRVFEIEKLKKLHPIAAYLFRFLKPFNFNESTVHEIVKALDGVSGKHFFSETHVLIKDRTHLIIDSINHFHVGAVPIDDENENSKLLIPLNCEKIKGEEFELFFEIYNSFTEISKSPDTASLDFDKLVFPLELRKWRQGDAFFPLGMKGKKKLSDFFIDDKVPLNEKEKTWLLTSEDKIVWVIGMRIDDRYKVTSKTKKIYFAELMK